MPNTYTLIESKSLTTTTASITFTSIPQTYTDLKLIFSTRDNSGSYINNMDININNSAANFSAVTVMKLGTSILYGTETTNLAFSTGSTATASTFTNGEVYFVNYTGSKYKSYLAESVSENNATDNGMISESGLWSNTAAITEIKFTPSGGNSFVANSTFRLYGIKNS